MSNVQGQIDRIRNNVEAALIAAEAMGIEVPEGANSDNLAALFANAGGIAVTGATPGQFIRIREVDDDGKPVAWEPVNVDWIPSMQGEEILAAQTVENGRFGGISEEFRENGLPIVIYIDGVPYESQMVADEYDWAANVTLADGSSLSFMFSTGLSMVLVMSGQGINGQTIRICTLEYNKIPDGYLPNDIGTDGSGSAIVDTAELPVTDINEDVFYRVPVAQFYYYGNPQSDKTCQVVATLPATGTPATDATFSYVHAYYAVDTGVVSGYLPSALAAAFGLPAGWYPAEALFPAAGLAYGGVVTDIEDLPLDVNAYYVFVQGAVKYRLDGEWEDMQGIGWRGDGMASEVFNALNNKATGALSHAEGGYNHAEGRASHAEGEGTHAQGRVSHAEGYETTASGEYSHAEGCWTTASGECSHVQGRSNIVDTENRYAHIVGNGPNKNHHSNAHTLDWDGNAWFAGDVYVGGKSQDDGERLVKKSELDAVGGASFETDSTLTLDNGVLKVNTTDYPSGSSALPITARGVQGIVDEVSVTLANLQPRVFLLQSSTAEGYNVQTTVWSSDAPGAEEISALFNTYFVAPSYGESSLRAVAARLSEIETGDGGVDIAKFVGNDTVNKQYAVVTVPADSSIVQLEWIPYSDMLPIYNGEVQ